MELTLDELRTILKEKHINPFEPEFDKDLFLSSLKQYKAINTEANSLLKFINYSHALYISCFNEILSAFNTISLCKGDLTTLFFRFCNHEYFKAITIITGEITRTNDPNLESQRFLQIESEAGHRMHAGSIPEMQTDITAELIRCLHYWKEPSPEELSQLTNNEQYIFQVQKAWRATNIIIILRDQCYDLILHDYCYPEWIDLNTVKIKRHIPVTDFIRTASAVRVSNHLMETSANLTRVFQRSGNDAAIQLLELAEGQLHVCLNDTKYDERFGGFPSLLKYHAPYISIPLEYFNGLTVVNLLKLFGNLVNAFTDFAHAKTANSTPSPLLETSFYLDRRQLAETLQKVSGYDQAIIEKFIQSLITNPENPYFWKGPFYELESKLLFSFPALMVPNFNLYIDKWISTSAFSYKQQVEWFKEFLVQNLQEEDALFEMNVFSDVMTDQNENIDNNILILTRDKALLLELVYYKYPVEYAEHEEVLEKLGESAIRGHNKLQKFGEKYKEQIGDRKLLIALVAEYPIYSGLVINTVPLVDSTLLQNYFFSGEVSKSSFKPTNSGFLSRKIAGLKYFTDETSFNDRLEEFLIAPPPVKNIINNLVLTEIDLLPFASNIRIVGEVTDHVGSAQVMAEQIEEVDHLMKYEYYVGGGKELAKQIEETITYHLSILLENIANGVYTAQEERMNLLQATMGSKSIGHAHLIFHLLRSSSKMVIEKKEEKRKFVALPVDDDASQLLNRLQIAIGGKVSLSEFIMPDIFTDKEGRQLVSIAINVFNHYSHKIVNDADIEYLSLNLLVLQGFRKKYQIKTIFFTACLNMLESLNQSGHYDKARNFCEEILLLCVKTQDHKYGWLLLFTCYSYQQNLNDAAFYGCLFFSSLRGYRKIPYDLFVSGIFALMKFLRNFGYSEYAVSVYKTATAAKLKAFDQLKISAVYFYVQFKESYRDANALSELPNFLDNHLENIKKFGTVGVMPWIGILLNMQRLQNIGLIKPAFSIQIYLNKLSSSADPDTLKQMTNKVLGTDDTLKDDLIESLLRVYETRDIHDYINEVSHLEVPAYNLIRKSIEKNDTAGVFLTSLILSDQTLTFKNSKVPGGPAPFIRDRNDLLSKRFNNYQEHLLDTIMLKPDQLIIWLFEYDAEAGYLLIDSDKKVFLKPLGTWLRPQLVEWTANISGFHFNAKNLSSYDYDLSAQEKEYAKLLNNFQAGDIDLKTMKSEVLICQSVDLSSMPHNLIVSNKDFLSVQKPLTNVISLQYFAENNDDVFLPRKYSLSAWIPTEDGNMTINWGFNNLEPILKSYGASIFTQSEPAVRLKTDINIFMAHGVREFSGFKAVRTNDDPLSTVMQPSRVFGTGTIAILFICNSGSSQDNFYSKQVTSFTNEVLRLGYRAVVSSFWPYDVTMANRWLTVFLTSIDNGHSVSLAVFNANNALKDYDSDTSTLFYAPQGRLSMHLYGNPNIKIPNVQ